jgi:hypothetical protein
MSLIIVNLTPDPRILRMLGQIELKGWQCIAELVDNSIDAMIKSGGNNENEIAVYIPTRSEINKNQPLTVRDNGKGMEPSELETALRAGYTSRFTQDTLGLFGMGFNIATARLGDVVEVWTSTSNMKEDIGIRIDLLEMQRTGSFNRELMTRTKSLLPSGTSIEISGYNARAEKLLNKRNIISELNRTYSQTLIDKYKITIKINNNPVVPFKFCTWDETRYVEYKGEQIPAIMHMSNSLGERRFCNRCFFWLTEILKGITTPVECPNCHKSDMIIIKEIAINGWLGIQRYNDSNHYGINIIRNGRIIKKLDKSFFTWQDRYEKNNGESIFEYPIDTTHEGGRIVGEINVDFIIPTYTKDSFEETDKLWLDAVELIRGKAPFQPQKATELGFSVNQSPLARLFYGYRRSSPPGKKHLIPGNSQGVATYQLAREWAQKYYDGDLEYQNDTKWWNAVLQAEMRETSITTDPTNLPTIQSPSPIISGTVEKPGDLYAGRKEYIVSKEYDLKPLIVEKSIKLDIFNLWPEIPQSSPVIFQGTAPSTFDVYINKDHALFRDFADGWEDLIAMEVATKFYERLDNPEVWTASRLYYELKVKYHSESMLNVDKLVNVAKSLMKDIQYYLTMGERNIDINPLPILNIEEDKLLKHNYLQAENKSLSDVKEIIKSPEFLKYMDFRYLFRFISQYPHLLFDGNFFALPYTKLDDDIKVRQLEQYLGYFNDIKWFIYYLTEYSDELVRKHKNMIIRNRFSLEYLNGNRA